ncbi:MAG: beta-propeller domain-containing protein, partial [Anaerolineaceae bacterium]|nr:beta-propeller domain-containing protein [Anaerolineaceae bacterium]
MAYGRRKHTAILAAGTAAIAVLSALMAPAQVTTGEEESDAVTTITIAGDYHPGCEEKKSCFDPYSSTVTRGQTVLWDNPTGDGHAIASGAPNARAETFDTGLIQPGYSAGLALHTPGEHEYFCLIHPWMTGVIHVTDAPAGEYYPPLHQYKRGVAMEHIACGEGRHLAYRTSDGTPACLKKSSLEIFAERGLAIPSELDGAPERIGADKEKFVRMLSDYIGHEDTVIITGDIDHVEAYAEKNEYKAEVMEYIRIAIHDRFGSPAADRWTQPWDGFVPDADRPQGDWAMTESAELQGARTQEGSAGMAQLRAGPPYPPGYSQTNIQVAGVDEPDFVKNDADSIYVIAQNDNIAMVEIDGAGRMLPPGISPYIEGAEYMLLHQDTLAVLAYDDGGFTTVTLIDVSAPGPAILADLAIDSELSNARMIDGTLYVMTRSDVDEPPVLHDRRGGGHDDSFKIHFMKNSLKSEDLYTITAISVDDATQARSGSFVVDADVDTIYVSRDSVYISHEQAHGDPRELFEDGLFFRHAIDALKPHDLAELHYVARVAGTEEAAYFLLGTFDDESAADLVAKLGLGATADTAATAAGSLPSQQTAIHRVEIDGTEIRYAASGLVGGWLLDSFALNQGAD